MSDFNSFLNKWFGPHSRGLELSNNFFWKLEKANSNDVVIYFLHQGIESEEKLIKRLNKKKIKLFIFNRLPTLDLEIPYVVVQGDWIEFQKELADFIWPIPSQLKFVGITGTNGKTTTADLALQIAIQNKIQAMTIGTLGVRDVSGTLEEFGMTTPGFLELREMIFRFAQKKELIIMEVSSHALDQQRIFGLNFSTVAWTSFSQDHLDYHMTHENYFNAKLLIFRYISSDSKLLVPTSQKGLVEKLKKNFSTRIELVSFTGQKDELPLFLHVKYNLDNLCIAQKLLENCGYQLKINYKNLISPPGRYLVKEWTQGRIIIIDFAHTPDALDKICQSLKETFPLKNLEVVFGCGGDRDMTKRPLMAQACGNWANKIWITSDNPRTEDPEKIIDDIEKGIKNIKYERNADRKIVIAKALQNLEKNHMLLIAGKGHENYIDMKGIKTPYSDEEEVVKYLKAHP